MAEWTRRVLLVEDEPLLASLMGQVLSDTGFTVEICADEREGRRALRTFDPDAALIDVHLGDGPFGIPLAHVITRNHPHVGVLLLSRFEDLSAAGIEASALPQGSAFLPKHRLTDRESLIEAVEGILRGEAFPAMTREDAGPLAGLTRTQLAVLRLAALGLTNAAIAERRGTTPNNVEKRLRSVYETLGIPSTGPTNARVEAVRRYVRAAGLPFDDTEATRSAR